METGLEFAAARRTRGSAADVGMTPCDTKSIVDWLTDGARSATRPETVLSDLCDRLVHAGIWQMPVMIHARYRITPGRLKIWVCRSALHCALIAGTTPVC